MELKEFNEHFLHPLMEELSAKDTPVYLIGNFNIYLMKIHIDNNTSIFFDSMTSNLFVPHIGHPARVTSKTKSLIKFCTRNIRKSHINHIRSHSLTVLMAFTKISSDSEANSLQIMLWLEDFRLSLDISVVTS